MSELKHLPVEPRSRAIVDERRLKKLDDRARAWIVERAANGKLEERLDPNFLKALEEEKLDDGIVEALIEAAAEQHVAQTRLW